MDRPKPREAKKHFLSRVAETHAKFSPSLAIHIDEIRVAGDWAFQRGSWVVTLVPRERREVSYIRQRYLEIWRRDLQERWKIAVEIDNWALD